jgi:hypothetical protein
MLDVNGQDLFLLQPGEDPIQHTRFAPAVHTGVDGMPVAKMLGQAAPFAPVLHHIEQGVEQLQIGHAHVAALSRQTIRNAQILTLCKLHDVQFALSYTKSQLVLTGPRSKGGPIPC